MSSATVFGNMHLGLASKRTFRKSSAKQLQFMMNNQFMKSKKNRVAFSFIAGERWTAGTYYLKNLFTAIRSLPPDEQPQIVLIVSQNTKPADYQVFNEFIDEVIVKPAEKKTSNLARLLGLLSAKVSDIIFQSPFPAFLEDNNIDLFFTRGAPPTRLRTPVLSWIPDYQHLHFPEFFAPAEIQSRQVSCSNAAIRATLIVLSSQSALEDCKVANNGKEFLWQKGRVLSFVAQVPPQIYEVDPGEICSKYYLPQKFFLLPNQFWKHKNHQTVVRALEIATEKNPEIAIVCTGNTNEYRDDLYFSQLLCQISVSGLREKMILLGLVPREDLFLLMRQSVAVLQPSLFEGWNTAIEEGKSIGKALLVSDIGVHREQGQQGIDYFSSVDAEMLADSLLTIFKKNSAGPDLELEKIARTELSKRTIRFGENFMELVQEATLVK